MEERNRFMKRKQPMVWTKNLTLQLIGLYESHSNLWDVYSKSYKNRIMRKLSMDEISNQMGISVKELNKKIHNLRCQFQSNHKKLSNSDENLSVKWEFYDALKFISLKSGFNDQIDSMTNEDNENVENCNYSIQNMHVENINKTSPVSYMFCEDSVSSDTRPIKVETSFPSILIETSPQKANQRIGKRKRCLEQELILNQCCEVRSKPVDSFKIFSDYIADELRTMNSKAPHLQSLAKRKIQRAILEMNDMFDERFHEIDNIEQMSETAALENEQNSVAEQPEPECEQEHLSFIKQE